MSPVPLVSSSPIKAKKPKLASTFAPTLMEPIATGMQTLERVKEKVNFNGEQRELDLFIPKVILTPNYGTSWFKDALAYQLDSFDDAYCDELLRKYEAIDWVDLIQQNVSFSNHLKKHATIPTEYTRFFGEIFGITPLLYQRRPEWIDRVLLVAVKAFVASSKLFTLSLYYELLQFMPTETLACTGSIDYSKGPVTNLFICYGVRVLRNRFPFTIVYVSEVMIGRFEECLLARTLQEHAAVLEEASISPYKDILGVLGWVEKQKK